MKREEISREIDSLVAIREQLQFFVNAVTSEPVPTGTFATGKSIVDQLNEAIRMLAGVIAE